MEADTRIGLAIEHAVAASRWRYAARCEGRTVAERFMRLARHRSAAATALVREYAETGAAGVQPGHPLPTRDGSGGRGVRRA
jgi:hypothetical protein